MRKVNLKVFFTTFLLLSLASLIPDLIIYLSDGKITRDSENAPRFIIMFIGVFMLIGLFSFVMDRIIFRRLKALNNATKEVMKGNYDVAVDEGAKDELSDVIRNFNTMVNELKANEYLSKEFVRNFSHELKTPLAAIKGYSELLLDDSSVNKQQSEYARIISNESSRLNELAKNMLLISLVDSQVIIPRKDTFNIAEQIRNVLLLTQLEWESKNLKFNLELPDHEITSNKELLYQVWMNLLSNAIKFSQKETTIEIDLRVTDKMIQLLISNEGSLDEDELKQIFDLFFVVEKSRTKQSSGVGLTLTKKIVTKLEGEIIVKSEKDNVIFEITLPIK